jgi:hypothetical protein
MTASLLIASLLAAPTAATATTQTARSGALTATLTFRGHFPLFNHLRLKITNANQVAYDAPVTARPCGRLCDPADSLAHQSSVHFIDLESTGTPDVVLDLYTGGAHCCFIEQVFSPAGTTYVKSGRDFGNAPPAIKDLAHDGKLELVSADNAFFYEFASFAASGAPIQIWRFHNRRFVNVTRSYPRQIAADAAGWWRLFTHHKNVGEGFIAAWAADQELLGHRALVTRRLNAQARQGHLHSDQGSAVPSGRKFVAALLRFLRRHGYIG